MQNTVVNVYRLISCAIDFMCVKNKLLHLSCCLFSHHIFFKKLHTVFRVTIRMIGTVRDIQGVSELVS